MCVLHLAVSLADRLLSHNANDNIPSYPPKEIIDISTSPVNNIPSFPTKEIIDAAFGSSSEEEDDALPS